MLTATLTSSAVGDYEVVSVHGSCRRLKFTVSQKFVTVSITADLFFFLSELLISEHVPLTDSVPIPEDGVVQQNTCSICRFFWNTPLNTQNKIAVHLHPQPKPGVDASVNVAPWAKGSFFRWDPASTPSTLPHDPSPRTRSKAARVGGAGEAASRETCGSKCNSYPHPHIASVPCGSNNAKRG